MPGSGAPPVRITLPPAPAHLPPAGPVPAGPVPGGASTPSGLFPSGPPRPHFREPHPVRSSAVAAGAGAAMLWMLLFGLLARTAGEYAWWSIAAGVVAWLAAFALARFGDRGVAVGVALTSGLGVAVAGCVVFGYWLGGHWLLW